MAKKTVKKPAPKNGETANKRLSGSKPGVSPISGTEPPAEYRFKKDNPGGPGAPKKLKGLQDLILETFGEQVQITDAEGQRTRIMRLQAMIRTMIIKSPTDRIALLEYVYGKVPQKNKELTLDDEIVELLREGRLTPEQVRDALPEDAEKLIAAAGLAGTTHTPTGEAQAPSPSRPSAGDGSGGIQWAARLVKK